MLTVGEEQPPAVFQRVGGQGLQHRVVALTPIECVVLAELARNIGRVLKTWMLLHWVWGLTRRMATTSSSSGIWAIG